MMTFANSHYKVEKKPILPPKYNFKVRTKVYTILDILSVNGVSENMGNYLYLWGIKLTL